MAIFRPKPWVIPFGKVTIFRLFELLVFIAQKFVFFVLEYHKRHFPDLYCVKTKVGKMVIFGPKPWFNPFGKISFFLFVQLRKAFFCSRISLNTFPQSILSKRKKLEKWPFSDQNHGLTPLEKCQFFEFLNFLFFQPRKAFFRSRISKNTFSWSTLRKKKSSKNGHFCTNTKG